MTLLHCPPSQTVLDRVTKSDKLTFGRPGSNDDLQLAWIIVCGSHQRDHIGCCQALHACRDAMQGVGVLGFGIEQLAADLTGCSQPLLASPRLLVEAGVLDGDACGCGQGQDQLLVLGSERATVDAVSQIQVAEYRVQAADRYAEERVIGGWPSGKPDDRGSSAIRVSRMGWGSSMSAPSNTASLGELADCLGCLLVHADMQELFEQAISADDSQCGVPGVRDISRGADNAVQYSRQGQLLNDRTVGGQQSTEPFLSCHDQRGLLDELAHQQLNG